jgi:hypothetical protein
MNPLSPFTYYRRHKQKAGILLALIGLTLSLYGPLGLRFNFFNPIPWLYTLPVPTAAVAATSGTVARTLSKLDPVVIIERR